MQVENKVFKAFIHKYGCTKVTIPLDDKKSMDDPENIITLRPNVPYYIADTPENQPLIRRFRRHPFIALTKELDAIEVLSYIMDPKNFPHVKRMIKPNSFKAEINKYKPEDDEVIINNLRKNGWQVMRLNEFNEQIMEVETAKKVLAAHGYTVTKDKDHKDVCITEQGPVVMNPNIVNKTGYASVVEKDETEKKMAKYEGDVYAGMSRAELNALAKELNINSFGKKTNDLIQLIRDTKKE